MILGFSGTRQGLSRAQLLAAGAFVKETRPVDFHHGCCRGADAEMHWLVRQLSPLTSIYGYPVCEPWGGWRVKAVVDDCDFCLPPAPPLRRNRSIVGASEQMLICPGEAAERMRGSGTWATWRETKQQRKPWRLILPDGTVRTSHEEGV